MAIADIQEYLRKEGRVLQSNIVLIVLRVVLNLSPTTPFVQDTPYSLSSLPSAV
jgi:hypothetical protein